MSENTHRYFIELLIDEKEDVSRKQETQMRRAQAERFVGQISEWLQKEELEDRVASIAVTALGQVLITCEQDIISKLREDENLSIASIRPGAGLSTSLRRVGGN
ncbi:MAG: hypothetical protein WC464_03920 [Bdellovibrionales bacterium]